MRVTHLKSLFSVLLLSAAAIAPTARAGVGHASEGYVYFHRAGATEADHHAALIACVKNARDLRWINPAVAFKKPADQIVADHFIVDGARRQLRANIENCMVANGWEVVRLEPTEGARLSRLSQPELAAALRPLLGAATVKGEVVRRFEPISDYFNGQFYLGNEPVSTSLSVVADAEVSETVAHASTAKAIFEESSRTLLPTTVLPVATPERLTSTSTVIVVRAVAEARGGFDLLLARADGDGQGGSPNSFTLLQAYAHAPKRLLDKFGPDQTLIYIVPPGRWRLISTSLLSFCLGAPAFDVKEGEAVFAGTFHGKPDTTLAPDMSLAQVTSVLPSTVTQRLKPAAWSNDGATSCASNPQAYWYLDRLEFSGSTAS